MTTKEVLTLSASGFTADEIRKLAEEDEKQKASTESKEQENETVETEETEETEETKETPDTKLSELEEQNKKLQAEITRLKTGKNIAGDVKKKEEEDKKRIETIIASYM